MRSDLRSFSDACRDLYAPGLRPENLAERGYRLLRTLVPCELIACGVLHKRTKTLEIGFDSEHPDIPAAMTALGGLMHKYPLFNWDPAVNAGLPFCRSHFFSARQFRDLDVYQEVYRPLGIDNHCAVHVHIEPGKTMFYGIERSGGPDFCNEDLALLELAQAQLSNAHALARWQSVSEAQVCPELLAQTGLTPREAETLYWIAEGKSNAEIAILMKIRLHTVKAHVASIFDKTGVGNRIAAILWARQTCLRLRAAASAAPAAVKVPVSFSPPPSKVG